MEFNGTFLVTIITFILFVILMNKMLYAPILAIMEDRKSLIDSNYKSAQENNEKSDELVADMESQLAEAREDARKRYNESVSEFKEQRSEIVADAQSSAKEELEGARIELENISNDVKNRLKGSMTDLANDIVEKVIGYRSEVQHFDDDAVNKVLWEK